MILSTAKVRVIPYVLLVYPNPNFHSVSLYLFDVLALCDKCIN